MQSLRFLASRRWVLFALVVAGLVYLAWVLGQWQFHRLDDRRERNGTVERNESSTPAPVESVLATDEPVTGADEWRLVTATGTYAPEETVIVRYRTRDGEAGVDVVVPLVTANGTALLVDRGWLATDNRGSSEVDVPAPPTGQVRVEGYLRQDATGDSAEVTDRSTRAISSATIGAALERRVYGGFVELRAEDPPAAEPLTAADLPDLGEGPHFFYGLQWWFFGLLAVAGFCYLAYDEWRGPRPGRRTASLPGPRGPRKAREAHKGSEGPEHAAVDREHHAGQE